MNILGILNALLSLDSLESNAQFESLVRGMMFHTAPTLEATPDGFVVRIGDMFIGMYEYCGTYFMQRRFDHVHY
jgi:hypothetical protein